ncbi:amino acid adenylation domain-containing protein [Pendulispora rubella]|uniref:Amino acid adenylation domain-containing protein n=1 Tax=Pendulispora rubella TaxID=2741070 RepID=A0ABZ2LFX6_9BACT
MGRIIGELSSVCPETVDLDIRFWDLGLRSLQVSTLVSLLSEQIGHRVLPTVAWQLRTPAALVRHVASLAQGGGTSQLAAIDEGQDRVESPLEPIAIVGLGCRFAGSVNSPDALWAMLCEGRHGVREVPADRWNASQYLDDDIGCPGKMTTRWGAFLENAANFDAAFFGISPREARQMDPQQRLALEVSWEALEDAGIDPRSLRGSAVGVYLGAMWSDYARLTYGNAEAIDAHTATGQDTSIISARVSYFLGLQGGSLTVNTASSSSAVAVHLACQSLRCGESHMALAGGVHLMSSPHSTVAMSKIGAMNPAGECRAFDASANGYVRGEGVGIIVLKRLRDAVANGDRIYCVIRGSAVNNDGFSNGLTAPNPEAQKDVLAKAYANAGLDPIKIHYVETHGSGTILGDPLEAEALGSVLGPCHTAERPLRIGSIKTNVGHTEAAAGVAGLLKVALCLHHGQLVPNLHFERPNPYIDFDELHLKVQTEIEDWPCPEELPRAGVSSFGFGGTNCHIVLEAAPASTAVAIPVSAPSEKALRRRLLDALGLFSRAKGGGRAATLCRELAARDDGGVYRTVLTAPNASAMAGVLPARLSLESAMVGRWGTPRPRLVFVCPGQGAQWLGMARSLLASEAVFRANIAICEREVQARCGWSLMGELLADPKQSRLQETDVSQLAMFSIAIALGELWRSWGIEPDALVGHSVGEVAACVLGGVLRIDEGVRIVAERARLVRDKVARRGAMLLVSLPEGDIEKTLLPLVDELWIAGSNSPSSVLLAGSLDAIARTEARLRDDGWQFRRVNVDFASHCPEMAPVLDPLRDALQGLSPQFARIPVRSTVRDAWLRGPECGPDHWVDNLRQPVRFRHAVEALANEGPTVFLELGPHPALLGPIEDTLKTGGATSWGLASCWRGEDERSSLLTTLATLYELGFTPDWRKVLSNNAAWQPLPAGLLEEVEAAFGAPNAAQEAVLPLPILLSASTQAALRAQAEKLRAHLEQRPEIALADVAHSLVTTRAQFEHRAAVIARDRADLLASLASIAPAGSSPNALTAPVTADRKIALLFSGQGTQRPEMGRALYQAFPLFRLALDAVCSLLDPDLEISLKDVLFAPLDSNLDSRLHQTGFTQPALFALEVALFRLLEAYGLQPHFLLGHSIGELVAAHVAGVLSLRDACSLVSARSRLMQAIPLHGAMLAVPASENELLPLLDPFHGRVSIAALNSPDSSVVAGDPDAVSLLARHFESIGRKASPLRVSHAFHSHHMDGMLDDFRRVAQSVTFHSARIPIISNLSGSRATDDELRSPDYWVQHVRHAVRFGHGVQSLYHEGVRTFLELGPRAALCAMAQEALPHDEDLSFISTLRKGKDDVESFITALASLHTSGVALDWNAFFAPLSPRRIPLPTYAFQRDRFWLDDPKGHHGDVASAGLTSADHPLLGAAVTLAESGVLLFTGNLSLAEHPWLADHCVHGTVSLPGTTFVELALLAAHRVGLDGIEELTLEAPLALPERGAIVVQLSLAPGDGAGRRALSFHSRPRDASDDAPWTRHANGTLAPCIPAPSFDLRAWPPPAAVSVPVNGFYEHLAASGLAYGPSFQGLRALWQHGDQLFAEVHLPQTSAKDAGRFALHPALLDAALHALTLQSDSCAAIALPVSWSGLSVRSVGATSLRVCITPQHAENTVALTFADTAGEPVGSVQTLETRSSTVEQLRDALAAQAHALSLVHPSARSRPPRPLASNTATVSSLSQRLLALSPTEREHTLLDLVRTEALTVLGLPSDASFEPHRPFHKLGLDSLTALELRNRLRGVTGQILPVSTIFNDSLLTLVNRLDSLLLTTREDVTAPPFVATLDRRNDPFPLTPVQAAYWVGQTTSHVLGGVATSLYYETDFAELDTSRLETALRRLIAHHDMLRAIVRTDGQQQVLAQVPPFELDVLDISHLAEDEAEARANVVREEVWQRARRSDVWPLFALRATRLPGGAVRVHIGIDMLLVDLHSAFTFARDLLQLYAHPERVLAPLQVTFRDYVLWMRSLAGSPALERARTYWVERVDDLPPPPELPLAVSPDSLGVPSFKRHPGCLDAQTWKQLKARASSFGLSPSAILLAAFAEVVGAWSRRNRFTLNLTLFQRPEIHPQLRAVIGDFTSLALVEIDLGQETTFADRARRHQKQMHDDLDHHLLDGVDVMREVFNRRGDRTGFPVVFTSGIGLSNVTQLEYPPGLEPIGKSCIKTQTPQVWLDHQVIETDEGLFYNWDVVEGLFLPGVIAAMSDAYSRLLNGLAASDDVFTSRDALLHLPSEQLERRAAVNATRAPAPLGFLHSPLDRQARERPDAMAVIDVDRRLTYAELTGLARRVARRLREVGVRRDELVAIVMDKGWAQIVGALAVLYAGGAYLPIAAELPLARRRELMSLGHVRFALTQQAVRAAHWPEMDDVQTFVIDAEGPWLALPDAPLEPLGTPDDLAYVIFTSGSTGVPKGVAIEHRAALNTVVDMNERFAITERDRVLGISSLSFDLSVWDIFGVLGAGGTLVLPEPRSMRDPERWVAWLQAEGITVWNSVPTLLQMLVEHARSRGDHLPRSLRLSLLSGDWIPVALPDAVRALLPDCQVISLGGATEASIWSITYPIESVNPDWTSIPYGRPMQNQTFHVLDDQLRPRPDFVTGELFIGGIGLAREYYGDPARTAERFFVHPRTGERLYRTGDLGRYLPSGDIEFLGRDDGQVKISGHRVELGEIQARLEQNPLVQRAFVSTVGDPRGARQLAAYVVLRRDTESSSDSEIGPELIRTWLRRDLPTYMVPAHVLVLDALPLTSNGKIDRGALPNPIAASVQSTVKLDERDDLLNLVNEEAAAVLELHPSSCLDSNRPLAELGLTSLAAQQLRNRLEKATGFKLPATLVFDHPTTAALARKLQAYRGRQAAPDPIQKLLTVMGHLETLLEEVRDDERAGDALTVRLKDILSNWLRTRAAPSDEPEAVGRDQLLAMVQRRLGIVENGDIQ